MGDVGAIPKFGELIEEVGRVAVPAVRSYDVELVDSAHFSAEFVRPERNEERVPASLVVDFEHDGDSTVRFLPERVERVKALASSHRRGSGIFFVEGDEHRDDRIVIVVCGATPL